MANTIQRSYIKNLAVKKLKEFKEFKEMILSEGIVSADAKTVGEATTIDAILDATTDYQASKMIDALLARKEPVRSNTYSNRRATDVINKLEKIKETVSDWDFE